MVCDRMAHLGGLDEDAVHWIGVAVRESVINAIKHGNREDPEKLVTVEFTFAPLSEPERARRARARSGRGIRSRRDRRPAGAREPAQGERPRHLLHAQLHGRRDAPARRRRRHGSAHGQEARRPVADVPQPAASSPRPSKRSCARASVQLAHFGRGLPHRQERRHRSRHRDRHRDRARISRR